MTNKRENKARDLCNGPRAPAKERQEIVQLCRFGHSTSAVPCAVGFPGQRERERERERER